MGVLKRDMDWKPIISFSVQLTFITVRSYIGLDHTNSPIKKEEHEPIILPIFKRTLPN
jgi:hypothetical protein